MTAGPDHNRITVVVPCRNAAPWIGECLDSLAGQTLRPAEIVVVDDGSTDASAEIVEQWSAAHGGVAVRLLRQDARGVAAALRAGFAAAATPLVARMDADDIVDERWLHDLAEALRAHPEAGYAYPAMLQFGTAVGRYHVEPFDPARLVIQGNFITAGGLIRRAAYDASRGVADLPGWEDWDLWLSLLEAGFPGVFVDADLYHWRRHGPTRNQLSWAARRTLRLRIWWRHRRLVRRYAGVAPRLLLERARHPVRSQ